MLTNSSGDNTNLKELLFIVVVFVLVGLVVVVLVVVP